LDTNWLIFVSYISRPHSPIVSSQEGNDNMGVTQPLLPLADEKAPSSPAAANGAFDETTTPLRVGKPSYFAAARNRINSMSKGQKIVSGVVVGWLALGAAHNAVKLARGRGHHHHRFLHGHGFHHEEHGMHSWDHDEVS
jgi:hypothetical protein